MNINTFWLLCQWTANQVSYLTSRLSVISGVLSSLVDLMIAIFSKSLYSSVVKVINYDHTPNTIEVGSTPILMITHLKFKGFQTPEHDRGFCSEIGAI